MKENISGSSCLIVRTLGGFSLEYEGKIIKEFSNDKASQDRSLLHMVIVSHDEGVSRDVIQREIFREKDLSDIKHTMQSVIYNLKRKLKASGLPDVNYIEQKSGICRWTKEIPLVIDIEEIADEFEAASNTEDISGKLEHYKNIIELYKGDFLQNQRGSAWAAKRGNKVRNIYYLSVEAAAVILRNQEDYITLEEIGKRAIDACPLQNWEHLLMEAYVAQGKYDEASKLYEDTVDLYRKELGVRPSDELKELFDQLGQQIEHQYALLDEIQMLLSEGEEERPGGYVCNYPVFEGIYRMIQRMLARTGQSVYLMLCTVVDSKGNPMTDGQLLDELSEVLGESIRQSVRHSDVINRYSKGQYLILLINTTRENCEVVQKRINQHFITGRKKMGVKYHVNSVVYENYDL